jgi:hypothetical protein
LHGVGDGTVNCKKYKPRLTRQHHHDAGLKGQLKAEKAAHEDATAARIAAYKDLYGRYVALEQKGLDAVAKTVEKDSAILANNDTRWSNLVKRLEERVAGSVPLANAIHVDIQHDEYINQLIDGVLHMQEIIKVWLPFDMILHEESDFVVYKKAKEEKPDGI